SYYASAHRYSGQFVSLGERLVGRDAISLAPGLNRHSILCRTTGDPTTARAYGERAVALAEQDPERALELASYLDELNRTSGETDKVATRALLERALGIRRSKLGGDAPEVAESMRGL